MPTIRNITQKDLVLVGKVVPPYKTINVSDSELLNLHSMINHNMIVVENFNPTSSNQQVNHNKEIKEDIDLEEYKKQKQDLMDAFFSLYLDKDLSKKQLETLKQFYIQIGPTSNVSLKTKSLLNEVNNGEELIEVLLNHIYPEFIKKQLGNL